MELTKKERDVLMDIVKKTIAAKVQDREMPKFTVDLPVLKEKRGAFVTIKKHNRLRGCIGYIKAVKPLWETVQEMAIAAAFHDPRFLLCSRKNFLQRYQNFEVSVLSPLRRINDINEIEVGNTVYTLCAVIIQVCCCRRLPLSIKWTDKLFCRKPAIKQVCRLKRGKKKIRKFTYFRPITLAILLDL